MELQRKALLGAFSLCLTLCCGNPPRNILKGKELILVPAELPIYMEILRNSTGYVIKMEGLAFNLLDWLASRYGFRYFVKDVQKTFESSGINRGLKSYLMSKEVDMVPGAIAITSDRANTTDFPFPAFVSDYGLIIPFPETTVNMAAPWETLKFQVWICLLVSFIAIVAVLFLINRGSFQLSKAESVFLRFSNSSDYILQVFFSQGGYCYPKRTSIRLVAATWCLAAFVVVNIYNTILISFVSSPNWQPMINSVYDIPNSPNVRVVVDEGLAADVIFTKAQSGVFKFLGDMLRQHPSLRCGKPAVCIEKVKSGSHAYVQSLTLSLDDIYVDFKSNGKCSITLAKYAFLPTYASFALPKGSAYTNLIKYGIISLAETGLPSLWQNQFVPVPHRCLQVYRQKVEKPRLGMRHLSSAFVILGVGCCLSLLAFVGELLLHSRNIRNVSPIIQILPINY